MTKRTRSELDEDMDDLIDICDEEPNEKHAEIVDISSVPNDLLFSILAPLIEVLTVPKMLNVILTCKRFCNLILDPKLWSTKYPVWTAAFTLRDLYYLPSLPPGQTYIKLNSSDRQHLFNIIPEGDIITNYQFSVFPKLGYIQLIGRDPSFKISSHIKLNIDKVVGTQVNEKLITSKHLKILSGHLKRVSGEGESWITIHGESLLVQSVTHKIEGMYSEGINILLTEGNLNFFRQPLYFSGLASPHAIIGQSFLSFISQMSFIDGGQCKIRSGDPFFTFTVTIGTEPHRTMSIVANIPSKTKEFLVKDIEFSYPGKNIQLMANFMDGISKRCGLKVRLDLTQFGYFEIFVETDKYFVKIATA